MNKLTAESARQELTKLKEWENDGVLTLEEERYMQALEIALPILEQQERGEGDWMAWGGRSIPRAVRGRTVQVRYACGETTTEYSGFLNWGDGVGKAVIAYRIIPERANKATLTDEKREWLIDECKADMQRYTSSSPRYLVAQIALASLEACYIIPGAVHQSERRAMI